MASMMDEMAKTLARRRAAVIVRWFGFVSGVDLAFFCVGGEEGAGD